MGHAKPATILPRTALFFYGYTERQNECVLEGNSSLVLNAYDAHPAGAPQTVQWAARVRWIAPHATVYLRDHKVAVANPVSFKPSGDVAPSALEMLLSALGGEVVTAFTAQATRSGAVLDAVEAAVSTYLKNPLVAAQVVGEVGSPALAALAITLYVASPETEETIHALWDEVRPHLPVYATLSCACPITLVLKCVL
jgi:hypothetical protein